MAMSNKKMKSGIAFIICAFLGMFFLCDVAYASGGYTTITIEAEDYESGNCTYALDSTDIGSWQSFNQFSVPVGTTHTVYVKDAAGNITSSTVYAAPPETETPMYEQTIPEIPEQESVEENNMAGTGAGTVTDYTTEESQEFYTITSTNGNNFYLIIDHRGNDRNVYFTKPVSELDLINLAKEAGAVTEEEAEEIKVETPISSAEPDLEEAETNKGESPFKKIIGMLALLAVIGGGYYYFKIYQKKKVMADEDVDALDMENFEAVDDEEDYSLFSPYHLEADQTNADDELADFLENNTDFLDDEMISEEEETNEEVSTEEADLNNEDSSAVYENDEDFEEDEEFDDM